MGKMYEHSQDSSLFCHALVSVAQINSGSLQNLGALKERAVNITLRSLKTIVNHCISHIDESSDQDLKRDLEVDTLVNERLHASLFFHILRSYEIVSSSASTFYGSIIHGWPMVDFEFYLELNHKQKWSDFFTKSASQLPAQVLVFIIKKVLHASFRSDNKYYIWHLVLQTIIYKILKISISNLSECTFDFDFAYSNNPYAIEGQELSETITVTTDDNSLFRKVDNISSVDDAYNLLCDILLKEVKQANDINLINLLLHAVKTLLQHKPRFCNKEMLKIYNVADECLRLNVNIGILKTAINKCDSIHISRAYTAGDWNIPKNYLILIINYYYFSLSSEEVLNLKNILECTEIPYFFPVILSDLSPYKKKDFFEQNDQHLQLLCKIIQNSLEGATYASEVLLSNPVLLEQHLTLEILKENNHVVNIKNIYPLILESVLAIQSEDFKIKLLKFFYQVLSVNAVENYNDVLKHILRLYGFVDNFKLPDYDDVLSLLVRQILNADNMEHTLLSLFIQSPETTLRNIIEETLQHGESGRQMIQVLRLIPIACTFPKDDEGTTPLFKVLQDYMEGDELEEYEIKHLPMLFEFLMKVHLETAIMPLDIFFTKCIVPCLEKNQNTELVLACSQVVMQELAVEEEKLRQKCSVGNLEVKDNRKYDFTSETLKIIVFALSRLISSAIESGCGRLKESLIFVLNAVERYQINTGVLDDIDREELQVFFEPLNEAIQVYCQEFLPSNTDFKNFSTLWLSCCKTSDFTIIEEKISEERISYPYLLNALSKLIPHLTTEEWKKSLTLAENFVKFDYLIEDMIQHSGVPFQLLDKEKSFYAIISCFTTSLYFTTPNREGEPLYTFGCFCSVLMEMLKEKEPSVQMILAVILDLCNLLNCLEPQLMSVFISVFFEIQNLLPKCVDKTIQTDCKKLIADTLKCLPDSSEKTDLLDKVKINE